MKHVLVLGANGSLAKLVIKELLSNTDVTRTLFLRNKKADRY